MTRLALKELLALLSIYLLAAGGLGWWVHAELSASAERLAEQTARLVGREVASAVQSAMPEDLPRAGSRSHRALLETVRAVAERSAVVEAVSLVGPDGRVAASDDERQVDRKLPTPDELFGADPRARLVDVSGDGLEAGHYTMEMPLLGADGRPTGYLTMTLASEELTEMYRDRRRRVSQFGAAALAVIGLLGFLLHVQLVERGRRLRRALDAALAGEPVGEPPLRSRGRSADPFAEALATAGRVGRELQSARRRSERVEQRLAQLGEILDVGVALLGPDKSIDFASDRARELLGLDDGGSLPDELVSAVDRAWSERRPGVTVEPVTQASGRSRRLRCQVFPLDEEECVGWLLVVRDASMLRLLEIDLRRAARLRVLSQVYVAVAHDLKAPLNGMVLNLELLRESLGDGTRVPVDKQRHWVEVIERELVRLRRSLETLLSQTAPTSDETERFDLRATVEEIEALLAPQARRQQARLVTDLPADPVPVEGHRDHLKQALLNVAINGLEVLGEGGTVEIALRGNGDTAALAVRDTGSGIPPELRQRIFDMHFSTKDSGTGIGLYVARSVVESEGGVLEVADSGPEGTTFLIRLPLALEAGEEIPS